MVYIKLVNSQQLLSQLKELFREYQLSLGISLEFQNFEKELAALPGKYASPQGRLYLAFEEEALAGCIALRSINEIQCEMKRLYVRPSFRGKNIGKFLANQIIGEAKHIGYQQMLLDTLSTMEAAQGLYGSLGFRETSPYYLNPISGALFMCLDLNLKD